MNIWKILLYSTLIVIYLSGLYYAYGYAAFSIARYFEKEESLPVAIKTTLYVLFWPITIIFMLIKAILFFGREKGPFG